MTYGGTERVYRTGYIGRVHREVQGRVGTQGGTGQGRMTLVPARMPLVPARMPLIPAKMPLIPAKMPLILAKSP